MLAGAAMAGLMTGIVARTYAAQSVNAGKASSSLGQFEQGSDKARLGCGGAGGCGAKHDCKGKNECKGKGGCKSGDNGCKGKNSCKGKGGCKSAEEPKQ
jgi:hypothetical protein